MNYFYWDASALGKRYANEIGTAIVNQCFATVPANRMMALLVGAGEVISILVRRRNSGLLMNIDYQQAMTQLYAEIINSPDFRLEPATDGTVQSSFVFIPQYSLNATDAIVLRSALTVAQNLRAAGDGLVLLASDARLLTAAAAVGLTIFNPETDSQTTLNALT